MLLKATSALLNALDTCCHRSLCGYIPFVSSDQSASTHTFTPGHALQVKGTVARTAAAACQTDQALVATYICFCLFVSHCSFEPTLQTAEYKIIFYTASGLVQKHGIRCDADPPNPLLPPYFFLPQKSGGLAALQQLAVPDLTERYMAALDVARQGEEAAKKGPSVEVAAATGFVKVGFRELNLQEHQDCCVAHLTAGYFLALRCCVFPDCVCV